MNYGNTSTVRVYLITLLLSVGLIAGIKLSAQSPVSIVRHITAGQLHTINLPDSLDMLLQPISPSADSNDSENESEGENTQLTIVGGKIVGYRVQVFSDNNSRTAKNEARSKQRAISARFPQHRSYVTFNSPYWRLRIGDFRTQQEAQEAAEELKRSFPAYGKEIRVVRDRINSNN